MDCFCGCGRDIKGMRLKAANSLADKMGPMLATLDGARNAGALGEETPQVEALVAAGQTHLKTLTSYMHGQLQRSDLDLDAMKEWTNQATSRQASIGRMALGLGYQGPASSIATLAFGGVRAWGTVVAVHDTGTTINQNPRMQVAIEAHPQGGPPLTVNRKLTVSRLLIPRVGETVEVSFDPANPNDFVFRAAPAQAAPPVATPMPAAPAAPPAPSGTGDGGDDRIEQLRRLGDLRDSGVLSTTEFEAEKQRILGSD